MDSTGEIHKLGRSESPRISDCEWPAEHLKDEFDKLRRDFCSALRKPDDTNASTSQPLYCSLPAADHIFQLIVETFVEGAVIIKPDGLILYCNNAIFDILGYSTEDIIGTTVQRYINMPDVNAFQKFLSQIKGQESYTQVNMITNDKHTHPVIITGFAFEVNGSKAVALVVTDIYSRVEKDLLLSRYELLYQAARDIMLFVRLDGSIIESNQAAWEAYGYTQEEFNTLTLFDLRVPGGENEVAQQMANANLKGILYEADHRRKDGTVFPVEVSSQGADIGGERVLLSIIRDITERKKAEKLVEENNKRVVSILESVSDGFISIDSNLIITYINSAGQSLCRKSSSELLGKSILDVFTEVIGNVNKDLILSAIHEEKVLSFEVYEPYLRIWFEIRVSPTESGFSVYFSDITSRKDIEVRRERARIALEEIYLRERRIAEILQRAFLPEDIPVIKGYQIAEAYEPAMDESLVGGDIYDVFEAPDDKLYIFVADVSGKGLMAARYGAVVKYTLRTCAYSGKDPGESLALLNNILLDKLSEETFVTCFLGVLDPATGRIYYANAGHEEPLMIRGEQEFIELTQVTGPALSISENAQYNISSVRMDPGDTLLLYTDGVTDARGAGDRMEQSGLLRFISGCRRDSAAVLIEKLLDEVQDRSGESRADDVAMLAVKFTGFGN